jgi:hypothetical protein
VELGNIIKKSNIGQRRIAPTHIAAVGERSGIGNMGRGSARPFPSGVGGSGTTAEEKAPQLPRRTTGNLMDREDGSTNSSLGGWKPLVPGKQLQ